MDGTCTPGLDSDPQQSAQRMSSLAAPESLSGNQSQHGHSGSEQPQASGHPKFSNGPHIRSRITVVCAECKRLKLKCDRRTPCSSCVKRDTVQRCVYSQAAAEKIDVQSLHNRLLVVEGTLAQITASSPSTPLSAALHHVPPFKPSFPSSAGSPYPQPSSAVLTNGAAAAIGSSASGSVLAGLPCNDRALLAIGTSGSSVVISLEEVASIWLNELDVTLGSESTAATKSSSSMHPAYSNAAKTSMNGGSVARVKLEPMPALIPPSPLAFPSAHSSPSSMFSDGSGVSGTFAEPVPYSTFLPASASSSTSSYSPAFAPGSAFSGYTASAYALPQYPTPSTQGQSIVPPQVTPALLAHLPASPAERSQCLRHLSETMILHPCFNVHHFEHRIEAMLVWGGSAHQTPELVRDTTSNTGFTTGTNRSREELARELFLGIQPGSKKTNAGGKEAGRLKPTLSFFAAACAAFALGALIARENGEQARPGSSSSSSGVSLSNPSPSSTTVTGSSDGGSSPAALFALSDQALSLFEKTSSYDIDSVVAMILQVLYLLHEGQMRVAQGVFPLVGKMINVARMMGLAMDPDEFPGTYSLFEAETRRRVWWDVYYYDLFVSDCMGQPPLIADNSFTTKLPSDVDEEQFSPSSTSLPAPPLDGSEKSSAYFGLKCKLAQLVKSVKKQTFKDPLSEDPAELSLDQAAAFEAEISAWLCELPQAFKLDLDVDFTHEASAHTSTSSFLLAQRCELVVVANRMILKLYLPFLKEGAANPSRSSHQAILGTINAAHRIIYASRLLHSVWRHTRPAAFEFYDFGRTLFDASVVCAHAVIQQPTSILAAEAMKSVYSALAVMHDLGAAKTGVEGANGENGSRGEAIRIVEMMKRKAEHARNSGSVEGVLAGTKRKRSEDDADMLRAGFRLPFVGASVTSAKTEHARPPLSSCRPMTTPSKDNSLVSLDSKSRADLSKQSKDKEKEKEKDKAKYPTIGIRIRPGQEPPAVRQRTASSGGSPPPSMPTVRMHTAQTAGVGPPSSIDLTMQSPIASSHPSAPGNSYPCSRPPTAISHEQMQQELSYSIAYNGQDDMNVDGRRYSNGDYSNSPQETLYDQTTEGSTYAPSHHSPASYAAGPSAHDYYMPYPSNGGAMNSYDAHAQQMAMMYGPTGAPPPIVTAGSRSLTASIPSTPCDPVYSAGPDNGAGSMYAPKLGKVEPSAARQIEHEYVSTPSSHPLSVPAPHTQTWAQRGPGEAWPEYRYYQQS